MKKKLIVGLSIALAAMVVLVGAMLLYNPDSTIDDGVTIRFVSGTEYAPSQPGKVIVELRDRFYSSISTATCVAMFVLPTDSTNAGTLPISFAAGLPLVYLSAPGTYSGNFTVPANPGVYTYSVRCINGSKTYYQSKTFHVNQPENLVWIGEGPSVVQSKRSAEFSWRLDSPNDWPIVDAKCSVRNAVDGSYAGLGDVYYNSFEGNSTNDWSDFKWCVWIPNCATQSGSWAYGKDVNYDSYNNMMTMGGPGVTNRHSIVAAPVYLDKYNWTMKADFRITSGVVGGFYFMDSACNQVSDGAAYSTFNCAYYGLRTHSFNNSIGGTWLVFANNSFGNYSEYQVQVSNSTFGVYNPAGAANMGASYLLSRFQLDKINSTTFRIYSRQDNGTLTLNTTVSDANFVNFTDAINISRFGFYAYQTGSTIFQMDDLSFGAHDSINVSYRSFDYFRNPVVSSSSDRNLFKARFSGLSPGSYYVDCDVTYGRFWLSGAASKFWDGNGKLRKYFKVEKNLGAVVAKG